MSNLKFKNPEIHALKRKNDNLNKQLKEFVEDFQKNYNSKQFGSTLNNIILEEVIKIVRKLSKKYRFDFEEAMESISKNKFTDTTPENLKTGKVDENYNEDFEEKEPESKDSGIFKQVVINGEKYYHKDGIVYNTNLIKTGSFIDGVVHLD